MQIWYIGYNEVTESLLINVGLGIYLLKKFLDIKNLFS